MADLKLEHLTKTFGTARAVDDISLDLISGEFVTLLGPSAAKPRPCAWSLGWKHQTAAWFASVEEM
jgi:ABC-type lipopolysaccharide export system ATPase subunit